jgi:hypothetical protein
MDDRIDPVKLDRMTARSPPTLLLLMRKLRELSRVPCTKAQASMHMHD